MKAADLPPGFRFHPTDEELIVYYLKNQATSKPCPISIIPEIDIYKFDPWELPEKTEFGENEWYFFSPRDRKYPKGVRPNRTAVSGYWKATGIDKAIHSDSKYVGVKEVLVFYKGKPPKGVKTNWIMHEYRLVESTVHLKVPIDSMRLDDWVLYRIYKKKEWACKTIEESMEETPPQMKLNEWSEDQKIKFQRNHFLHDNVYPSSLDLQNPTMELEQDQFSYPNLYDNHLFNPTFLFNSSCNESKFSV